jgi:hypothetical protein
MSETAEGFLQNPHRRNSYKDGIVDSNLARDDEWHEPKLIVAW